MINLSEKTGEFISAVQNSLRENTFVKISLGNYKGKEENLKNVYIKRVLIKSEEKLSFTYRYKTRDIVKNYAVADGIQKVENFLDREFYVATLFMRIKGWIQKKRVVVNSQIVSKLKKRHIINNLRFNILVEYTTTPQKIWYLRLRQTI